MNCRSCNTRLPSRGGPCPSCGRSAKAGGFIDRPSGSREEPGSSGTGPLSPSSLAPRSEAGKVDYELDEEVELPLEDSMAMGRGKAPGSAKSGRPARPTSRGGSGTAARPASGSGVKKSRDKSRENAGTRHAGGSSGGKAAASPGRPGSMPLEAEQVRHLVVAQPDLLEPGLRVHTDERGREVGVGFDTDIGEIDLLARDERDDWVVVMVADAQTDPDVIQGTLHRIGWVTKHLMEQGESTRGIVLIEQLEEELSYAAAAVADTIDFKTWRLSLSFERLEA